MTLTHSYSSIKDFEGCQRRYHVVKILKKYKQQDTTATLYGTEVHKAFEDVVAHDKPLDPRFQQFAPFVYPLKKMSGEIFCERKMGMKRDFSPCDFFDPEVWIRGIPDVLAVNQETRIARVSDYKTGKSARFADTSQLELMAAMVMQHYPEIKVVKGALLFVVAQTIINTEYHRYELPGILSKWAGRANQIEKTLEIGVWNASPSGLCKFCPLPEGECEHR